MDLSSLESDLISDLAQDSHGLWEIFEFVKLHNKGSSEQAALANGRELLASWLSRGWISLSEKSELRAGLARTEELLPLIDRLGADVLTASGILPWVDLSEKAFRDVAWLQKPSNPALKRDAQKRGAP